MIDRRSGCPINLTLEALGDRWSLIVIRDLMFGGRRHFRDLLTKSEEGIASNILADRLKRLVEQGLLTRAEDPKHKQRGVFSLTDKGIDLLPLIVQLGAWGRKHQPTTPELAVRQQMMEEGGPELIAEMMAELRHVHLDGPMPPAGASVSARLQAAFEAVRSGS